MYTIRFCRIRVFVLEMGSELPILSDESFRCPSFGLFSARVYLKWFSNTTVMYCCSSWQYFSHCKDFGIPSDISDLDTCRIASERGKLLYFLQSNHIKDKVLFSSSKQSEGQEHKDAEE